MKSSHFDLFDPRQKVKNGIKIQTILLVVLNTLKYYVLPSEIYNYTLVSGNIFKAYEKTICKKIILKLNILRDGRIKFYCKNILSKY